MFVHMSIHYPHKSTKSKLRDSMHRFGEIEFLIRKHENVSTIAENEKKYISDSIDMTNLENIYFNIDDKKK